MKKLSKSYKNILMAGLIVTYIFLYWFLQKYNKSSCLFIGNDKTKRKFAGFIKDMGGDKFYKATSSFSAAAVSVPRNTVTERTIYPSPPPFLTDVTSPIHDEPLSRDWL